MNEGLCISNNQAGVDALFTDGLAGCAQVILRSELSTFLCHIGSNAPKPADWMGMAYDYFYKNEGHIEKCTLITANESDSLRDSVGRMLSQLFGEKLVVTTSPGALINMKTGNIVRTPSDIYAVDRNVAGCLTAPELIKWRLIDVQRLGEAFQGDFSETCAKCNR
jgi:hypothetical protein